MDRLFNIWGTEKKPETQNLPPRLLDKHPELIDRDRLRVFQNWANEKGEGGLFGKLVDNLRFIDKEDMQNGVTWMKDRVKSFIGTDDYLVVVHRNGHSGEWVFNQLGLRPPVAILEGNDLELKNIQPHYRNRKIVFPDDGSYSGSQVVASLRQPIKDRTINTKDLGLFFIGTTHMAEKTIQKYFKPKLLVSRYNIPTISDIFNDNEKYRLQKMFDGWAGHYDQAVLTFLYSRIPDNFFGGLKSSIGQKLYKDDKKPVENHYLFNDWRNGPFKPPYRKNKNF